MRGDNFQVLGLLLAMAIVAPIHAELNIGKDLPFLKKDVGQDYVECKSIVNRTEAFVIFLLDYANLQYCFDNHPDLVELSGELNDEVDDCHTGYGGMTEINTQLKRIEGDASKRGIKLKEVEGFSSAPGPRRRRPRPTGPRWRRRPFRPHFKTRMW